MKTQRKKWLDLLKSACRDVSGFSGCLVIRILLDSVDFMHAQTVAKVVDSGDPPRGLQAEEELDWRLRTGCYWISLLTKECPPASAESLNAYSKKGQQVSSVKTPAFQIFKIAS